MDKSFVFIVGVFYDIFLNLFLYVVRFIIGFFLDDWLLLSVMNLFIIFW